MSTAIAPPADRIDFVLTAAIRAIYDECDDNEAEFAAKLPKIPGLGDWFAEYSSDEHPSPELALAAVYFGGTIPERLAVTAWANDEESEDGEYQLSGYTFGSDCRIGCDFVDALDVAYDLELDDCER